MSINYETYETRPISVVEPFKAPPAPSVPDKLDAARERAEQLMRAHPAASIGIGVAIGLVLARVLR